MEYGEYVRLENKIPAKVFRETINWNFEYTKTLLSEINEQVEQLQHQDELHQDEMDSTDRKIRYIKKQHQDLSQRLNVLEEQFFQQQKTLEKIQEEMQPWYKKIFKKDK